MTPVQPPPTGPALAAIKNQRKLSALAGTLAFFLLLLGVAFVQYERHECESNIGDRIEFYAKLLEHQTSADIALVEATVEFAGEQAANHAYPGRTKLIGLLGDALRGRPQLRSLSVLNASGRVLASSAPANVGVQVDLGLLGPLPEAGAKSLPGRLLNGRDLSSLQPGDAGDAGDAGASGWQVLPLLHRLPTSAGEALWLVAMINVDYFSTQYSRLLNDDQIRVALLDYSGQLLAVSSEADLATSSSLSQLPVFKSFLPKQESGRYVGSGIDGRQAFTAFRTTRQWPMLVLVGQSYDLAMNDFRQVARWTATGVASGWMLILAVSLFITRGMRSDAAINDQLHQAHLAVYASEARLRVTLESSLDGVLSIDENGCIQAFNPAAEEIFGYASVDIIGKPMDQFLVPSQLRHDHKDGIRQYIQSHTGPVLKRRNRRMETTALRADGSIFPIELTIVSASDQGHIFFTATVRDITEKKRIEAEKASLLSRYQKLAADLEWQKMALDQHAIVNIVDDNDNIIYANDKLLEVAGFAREEMLGHKFYEFHHYLSPELYAERRACYASGKTWHGELPKRRRDGSIYWVANTSVPVPGEDGHPRQWIDIQTDISALRKAEMALQEARAREMEIGNRIQQSLLSARPAQDISGIWLSCYNQASKGVDGDFVDVIRIGDHCIDILVGDVMGKGVPAALMGAGTKLQFSRSIAELLTQGQSSGQLPQPCDIVASVHRTMTPHLQALEAFVTLVYLRIDTLRDRVTWVGCGHEETMITRAGQASPELLANQHPPLGVLDSDSFMQDDAPLAAGDALFLCSDGLTDAVRADGERVGRELLNQTLQQLLREQQAPAAVLHSLRRDILADKVQINDDITMVMVMRKAEQASPTRCELAVNMNSLRTVREFVVTRALEAGMSEPEAAMFEVASVEVFTNIVRHAKGLLPDAPVELIVRGSAQEFVLDIVLLGEAFTPPENTIIPDLDTFPEGGFGLTIIRNACDRVEYLHHQGVNTVRMTRAIRS